MAKVLIVKKIVEEVEISEETLNSLEWHDNMTDEAVRQWHEFGEKFAEPYGGWSYGPKPENGIIAVYHTDGELITQA